MLVQHDVTEDEILYQVPFSFIIHTYIHTYSYYTVSVDYASVDFVITFVILATLKKF